MMGKKNASRLYYKVGEVAQILSVSEEEVLSRAALGDLPIMVPHFGNDGGAVTAASSPDPDLYPEVFNWHWGVSLQPEDLSRICRYGSASVAVGFRPSEDGLEVIKYQPPRLLKRDDLVVPAEYVDGEVAENLPVSESERKTLLKMIAVLGLALAGKDPKYFHGTKLNCLGIANAVKLKVGECPDEFKSKVQWEGIGEENLRKKMSDGAKLLFKKN